MYKKENVEQFHKDTLEDYNQSLIIEDIVKVDTIEKTDNSFIQIGIRPILDDEMFISPNFDPRLPSAGRMVAIGEEDFLISTILDNKEIKKTEIKENIEEFPKYVYGFNDAIILISNKFFVEIFTKLMHRIDYEERYPRLDNRYKIIVVPEKVLNNKIIIMDKNAVLWKKQIFDNRVTGKKEKLDINIKPVADGKVDISIRSVNKIAHIDTELIKILEVAD